MWEAQESGEKQGGHSGEAQTQETWLAEEASRLQGLGGRPEMLMLIFVSSLNKCL